MQYLVSPTKKTKATPMSSNTSSILAAVYLDQLIEEDDPLSNYPAMGACVVQGSMFNPLDALGAMCINVVTETNYEREELSAATGAPLAWFNKRTLDAPLDEVLPVLGKLALIYLSSIRNYALLNAPLAEVREDSLKAVSTMSEVLQMNRARMGAH